MKQLSPLPRLATILRDIPASLSAGLVIGILVIFIQVSLAAMIFSGELSTFLPQGIGILLLGALIIGLAVTVFSSFPGAIALPQDASATILSVVAAAIAAGMPRATSEETFASVVAAMMLSSVLIGIFFWLMGRFNLGRLVRFIPYPVVGGFLAGMGWLLLVGSIGVMTDAALGLALFDSSALPRWIPGLLFALVLLVLTRRYSHFLLMPMLLIAGISLFYLVYFLVNGTVDSLETGGWLLGPFPEGSLWQPVTNLALTQANWPIVLSNIVDLSTIFIVCTIAFLLNASGVEIAARTDIDLNRELQAVGVSNVLAGIAGSPAGYHALSLSTLGHRFGAQTRLVGLFSLIVVGGALFFGASVLSIFPRMIAGAFLLFLGFTFLTEWLYDAWFKLPKLDYLLIWLILITIATVGLLQGVIVGITVAVILFVVTYTKTNMVRHTFTRENFQSYVMRPPIYEQLLQQQGGSLAIFELQGFIFFGTAHGLVEQIQDRIDNSDLSRLRFLLLDFRLVTGIDSSATFSFSRLRQIVDQADIRLVITNLTADIRAQLHDDVLSADGQMPVQLFPDLDQGVAWVDEQIISTDGDLAARPETLLQYLDEVLTPLTEEVSRPADLTSVAPETESLHHDRILTFMQRQEVGPGTILLHEGQPVDSVYFVDKGQIAVQTVYEDGQIQQLRIQEAGTVFGEIGIYSGQMATATVVSKIASVFYSLSAENFTRMESQDPELAIAIHRLIAGVLGRKLTQANYTIIALQK